mgnify:CR=1 FL=1
MAVSLDAQAAIADIAKSLEGQSGEGEFLENFIKSASESEIKETAKLESDAFWDGIKQKASAAGVSIMDWMGETAFQGSQNPAGLAQKALAAISHPFAKTAEVAFDYINPKSPGGYMHSEELPDALSFLNENAYLRKELAKNPALAVAPAFLGGFAYPINEWAKGKDVTKGALGGGLLSLGGPMAGLISRTAGAGVRRVAPNLTDDMVDQSRRAFNKALVAGSALGATGAGVATVAKGLGKTASKPVVKAGAAGLAKVSLVTERLYGRVADSLRISLKQAPDDYSHVMKVDDLYPNRAAGGTATTEDLGYQPGKVMSMTLDSTDNQATVGFFEDVIKTDNRLSDAVKYKGKTLDQTELPDVLQNIMYGVHRRANLKDDTLHRAADAPAVMDHDGSWYDDIAEAIGHNIDAIDDATFGRSMQDILSNAQKTGIDVTEGIPALRSNRPKAQELLNPEKAKQVDRYLEYHSNSIQHVARSHESMVYGSDLIEHLAKTDPEHLANVMRAVISKAEKALATPPNTINASGGMVRTDHAIEQFKLDTAKEILEALLGG